MSLGHGLLFLFGLFVLMISFLLKKLFLFSFFFLFLFLSSLLDRRKYINIKLKQDYSIPKDFMLHKLLFPQGSGNLHSTHPIDNRNPLCREKLVLFFFFSTRKKNTMAPNNKTVLHRKSKHFFLYHGNLLSHRMHP